MPVSQNKKTPVRVKENVYNMLLRVVMLETGPLIKRQEQQLEALESKILRFTLGWMRIDRVRNEYITRRESRVRTQTLGVLGEDGAARQEEQRKIYRCGEGGHTG